MKAVLSAQRGRTPLDPGRVLHEMIDLLWNSNAIFTGVMISSTILVCSLTPSLALASKIESQSVHLRDRDVHAPALLASRADVAASLVINEVDYDQPGSDGAEFVEIYNAGGEDVGLDGVSVLGINGDGTEYRRIALPDVTLIAGDWYVVGSADVPEVDLVSGTSNIFQNGAPDAVALVYSSTGDPDDEILVDSVSYEGETTGGPTGGGTWTEGSAGAPADDGAEEDVAIGRYSDGTDSDVNANDFAARCATPGEANSPDATCDSGGTPTPEPSATLTPAPTETPPTTPTTDPSATPAGTATPSPTPEDIGGLAVELLDFQVRRIADGSVIVKWITLSEIDHGGFRIIRQIEAGPESAVGGLIAPRGDAFVGAKYLLADRAAPTTAIRYWLDDIDTLGKVTRHGPVSVAQVFPPRVSPPRIATHSIGVSAWPMAREAAPASPWVMR